MGSNPDEVIGFFSWHNRPHYVPGVDTASNRNEYQDLPGVKGRPERKADNVIDICEAIV
jgi:hypothetical protein